MSLQRIVIDNIRRIRKEKGITQEKLAEACDTTTSYIGLMEIYRNTPKLDTIERIAAALEVDPLVLFKKMDRLPEEKEVEIENIKKKILSVLEKEIDSAVRALIS
jgi:transcriptional regulator with XRE-family HTH domain